MSIQLILFIQGVHICKFTDVLQFVYKHIISTQGTVPVILRHVQSEQKFESLGMQVSK